MSNSKIDGSPIKEWGYDHFIGFILLYAAHADFDYSESEKQFILAEVSPAILHEVEIEFNQKSDFEQLQTILQLKDRFITTEKHKELVLGELGKLFRSDGDYSKLESSLFEFLKRLL